MKIPLYRIYWDEEDINAVSQVIRKASWWTKGVEINEFEEKVAKTVNRRHAVALNSGTSALYASMLALGIGAGEEVIVPSFTFISTALAPQFVDAKPVFADIEQERLALDPEDVKEKITRNTAAIIPIHYGGLPCHIKELAEIAEDHNISLVEDSAEALGAHLDGRMAGSFGDISILSFTGNKIITMGEGGMALTDNGETYEKLLSIRDRYSWRLSTIQAALGLSQLNKMPLIIRLRRQNAQMYTEALNKVDKVSPMIETEGCFNIRMLYTVKVEKKRDEFQQHLSDHGISTKVYFHQLHDPKCLHLPVTEEMSKIVLSLPVYPTMTIKEIEHVLEAIRSF